MRSKKSGTGRRSAVALMFAIMAIPLLGLVGLAIDYGYWNEAYTALYLAANVAALNAVKTAAGANTQNDANYLTEGATAGTQWFEASVGQGAYGAGVTFTPTVSVTRGTTIITANVSYTGTVRSFFGKLFKKATYPVNVAATATISVAPYINVEILLDNSPSMEIGATPGDIAAMMYLTPCTLSGAMYGVVPNQTSLTQPPSSQNYAAYACTSINTYDGQLALYGEGSCPIQTAAGLTATPVAPTVYDGGPFCTNLAKQTTPAAVNGQYPLAGPPCAFACHFDTTDALAAKNDYYGLARSTIGKSACYLSGSSPGSCGITLRFDLVKNAVDQVISTMQSDNVAALNNLGVGVFTFDTGVEQIYPSASSCGSQGSLACQAGSSWTTALNDVGAPPTQPNTVDTGIQPYTGGNGADTDLTNVLSTLASTYLTAAGNGTSSTQPQKVLFLVTDGMADYGNGAARTNAAIDPNQCQTYKNMGYSVYVVYTPYYPLMNSFYLQHNYAIAEGTGSGSLAYNLQQCSSDPTNDFIEASPTDQTSITKALELFLQRALNAPARFTN